MKLFYSLFFGAGVAAIAYNTWARRIGYANTKNVTKFVGVIFIFSTIIFYTILVFIF